MSHPFHLLLLALTLPARCLTVQGYNPTEHDRFTGFPAAPVMNPGFLYDATKFTGVGWWVNSFTSAGSVYSQVTAISPRHLLTATHATPPGGTVIHFVDSTGALVDRAIQSATAVPNGVSGNSDLCVMTLVSPLPPTVATYPWLNLAGGESSYEDLALIVLGQIPNATLQGGECPTTRSYEGFVTATTIGHTRAARWVYHPVDSPTHSCALSNGDSGGPSFHEVGEQPAIVGVHMAIDTVGMETESYDTFVPHYADGVDTILAPAGHRLRPVNFTPTTLAIPSAAASPVTLRRFNPGSISFSVANTGSELTGNLAVTITFSVGSEPSSLTAPGWVVEPGGTGVWHLRAATLAAGANLSFTADWAALPDLASITADLTAGSDTASAIAAAPSFTLAPSYAEWADGLAMPGQTEDPDGDDLENLLEYALGGDPENGAMFLPGDHPLRPVMTESGGTIRLSFPERGDAVLRGISYIVETSTTLEGLAGSITLPEGASSSAAPFVPEVPGFVKRTITWPSDSPRRFARLKVELAE